jgi:hypothetical protein
MSTSAVRLRDSRCEKQIGAIRQPTQPNRLAESRAGWPVQVIATVNAPVQYCLWADPSTRKKLQPAPPPGRFHGISNAARREVLFGILAENDTLAAHKGKRANGVRIPNSSGKFTENGLKSPLGLSSDCSSLRIDS